MKHLKWVFSIVAFIAYINTANSQPIDSVTKGSTSLRLHVDSIHYLRQGDHLEFIVKIENVSGQEITGQVQLELLDAASGQSVDGWFQNVFPNQYFTVAARQSEAVKFPMEAPYQFTSTLKWKVTATSETLKENKEGLLPVLSNQKLLIETLPFTLNSPGTKTFTFNKLLNAGNSESLQHKSLSVEYSSNTTWFAVQALPFLMEYPAENAEQIWNRIYANLLAAKIIHSSPRIQQLLSNWATADTTVFLFSFQLDEELKATISKETPWVLHSPSEQKQNLALLFDLPKMIANVTADMEKLKDLQKSNGGFPWFKGGADDRYITQYILTGIGRLKNLNAIPEALESSIQQVVSSALFYADAKLTEDYNKLVTSKLDLRKPHTSYISSQYLYMRSFFPNAGLSVNQKVFDYYREQVRKYWITQNKYGQGMIALALSRMGDKQIPKIILRSLKATSITNELSGTYWKENKFGKSSLWYEAPIETQSLLTEAFNEINTDTALVENLKNWLIQNKQAAGWQTTKATADAVYALLLHRTDWTDINSNVVIKLGATSLSSTSQPANAGYFFNTIPADKITHDMGNISVTVPQLSNEASNSTSIHGAVYWQYFEDRNKAGTALPVKISRKLFVSTQTNAGIIRKPIEESTVLHVGDKITVQLELRTNSDMEYIQMKDLHASGLVPVTFVNGYKQKGSLGYYESTGNTSTSFYFNNISKGSYIFEYPLIVKHTGTFSNGITIVQCLYAPELNANIEGMKITVE